MVRYEESPTQKFVNPYYFIPLEYKKGCTRNLVNDYTGSTHTGWLECTLKTLTPIFIPNSSNCYTFSKYERISKSYDFYSYQDLSQIDQDPPIPKEPVIPGSEIRGMIRSIYETLTNSCLSVLDTKRLFKRTTIPGIPGRLILENNEWYIEPCERIQLSQQKFSKFIQSLKEGQKVYIRINRDRRPFKVQGLSSSIQGGYEEGFYHKGESFLNKKNESIFILKDDSPIKLHQEDINRYKYNIELYQKSSDNIDLNQNNHQRYKDISIENDTDLNGALIYYKEYNDQFYIGPAAIGRQVFQNTIIKIVDSYHPCDSDKELCSSCTLFGFVGEKYKRASMLRFTDAILKNPNIPPSDLFFEPGILPELASPKLSATEFYLKKPKQPNNDKSVDLWNYDYAGSWYHNDFISIDSYKPEIQGRKFYWHHKIDKPPFISSHTKRNVAIRPLKPNISFKFKVFFNNISIENLLRLLWILELGHTSQNAHKIGMGKPIGLGSVLIEIESLQLRNINLKNDTIDYSLKSNSDLLIKIRGKNSPIKLFGCDKLIFDKVMIGTNFVNPPSNIQYPINEGESESYKWFVENRKIKGTGTHHVINQTLPTDLKNPKLSKYRRISPRSP